MPLAQPPRQKLFHLFVEDHGFHNPASYVAVNAELRGVGKYCQVYVDRDHPDPAALRPAIDEVIRTFDTEIRPRALGRVLDVDRDGRFTMLFSGQLGHMQTGTARLSGYLNPQLATSVLAESYVFPNQSAWDAGVRTVICEIRGTAGKLTGSVRGLG